MYGNLKKRRAESGVPKVAGSGRYRENYTALRCVSQSKKGNEVVA